MLTYVRSGVLLSAASYRSDSIRSEEGGGTAFSGCSGPSVVKSGIYREARDKTTVNVDKGERIALKPVPIS